MNELEPIIPDDWFVLDWPDKIKSGDMWRDGNLWREVGEAEIGKPAIVMMTPVIRKKESTQ